MKFTERSRSAWVLVLLLALAWGGMQLLQSNRSVEQGQVLRELAQPGDILMISTTTCIYCTKARRWLTEQQVPHRECFIERDAQCRAEYQARGAQGTPTMVVRGRTQLGFDPERVAQALKPG